MQAGYARLRSGQNWSAMDKSGQISELLRKITGTDRPTFDFMPMEVVSVDGDLCVCRLDELEIPDVRLSAIPEGSADGLLITPKVGSVVMVADLSAGTLRDLMVVQYTEIETIRFHQGATTITADGQKAVIEVGGSNVEITDQLISFNKGANDGLLKVVETTSKINAIENDLNTLKMALTDWIPINPEEPDAAALKAAITGWAAQKITPTAKEELLNDKVKH